MADDLRVIYRAETSQQAHLLKNLLADRGIQAVVTNDVLERGAGVDVVGWPTLARVSVAERDAEDARQLALELEKTVSDNPELADQIDASGEEVQQSVWPECPECGAARPTRCPICETTGTDFPPADRPFVMADAEAEADAASGCGCGSHQCSSHGTRHEQGEEDEPTPADRETEQDDEPPEMVVCTTCDEPFVPAHPNRCAWCGHQFPDGYDVPDETELLEPIPARAIMVIAALLALAVGLVVYFTVIM